MYVTGGQYKGHKIIIPDCAKPTLSKTRESLFNVLYSILNDFEGRIFLDLYSGSGIMSMEALSRGFETCSIDINPKAVRIIKANLKKAKENHEVILADALKFIEKTTIAPDVVYIDPPWETEYKSVIEKALLKFKGAIIVIESDKKRMQELSEIYAKTSAPFREKVYGRCKLDFIKN